MATSLQSPTAFTYQISAAQLQIPFSDFSPSSSSCTISYSLTNAATGLAAPSLYSIDTVNKKILVGQSYDNSLVTSFTLKVTGYITGYPTIQNYFYYTFTITSSCSLLSLTVNG